VKSVSVYLAGTQIGTRTDAKGKYELIVSDIINTSLVFSHISYEQLILLDPYKNLPDTISLISKDHNLKPVEVVKRRDPYQRAEKMRAFRRQFLGTDNAGKSCTIANEDDIHLFYDVDTKTLSVSSETPLIIENKYLAYDLYFELLNFDVTYMFHTLSDEWVTKCKFYGTVFFSDQYPDDKKIQRRRKEVYQKSELCFFKNFVNNTLEESKFIIFSNGAAINPLDYFTIQDTLSLKVVSYEPGTLARPLSIYYDDDITGSIGVVHNKKERTSILFRTDFFIVDRFGYTNTEDNMFFSGEMGQQRIGNMLPIDYLPDEGKPQYK
jgi:hypothetical protein